MANELPKVSGVKWYKATVICRVGIHKNYTTVVDVLAEDMRGAQAVLRQALQTDYSCIGMAHEGTAEEYYKQVIDSSGTDDGDGSDTGY